MVAEKFSKFCQTIGSEVTQSELISLFSNLCLDKEPEVRTAAAFQIAGVCSLLSKDQVVSQILPAPERKNDIYYALSLADAVYGSGGFGTRLNLNLREDKGYTYGVRSGIQSLSECGIWIAGGGVQGNKTKESMIEFLNELDNLGGKKPISENELNAARTTRLRGYAQRFESLNAIAMRVGDLWTQNLPMTEFQKELDETQKLSLDAVNKAAQSLVKRDKAFFVLVGDLKKIKAGLEELKAGEIVVLDKEGKEIK